MEAAWATEARARLRSSCWRCSASRCSCRRSGTGSRHRSRGSPASARSAGNGFWSGLVVGGALGFLYAPCAGPILAAVVSVSASQGSSLRIIVLAAAYSLGSAAVLLLLALG